MTFRLYRLETGKRLLCSRYLAQRCRSSQAPNSALAALGMLQPKAFRLLQKVDPRSRYPTIMYNPADTLATLKYLLTLHWFPDQVD